MRLPGRQKLIKKIGAYNNKTSLKTTIGDIKTRVDNKEVILPNDE